MKYLITILAICIQLISTLLAQPHIFSGDGDGFGNDHYLGNLNGESYSVMFGSGISDGYDNAMTGGTLNGINSRAHFLSGEEDGFAVNRFLGNLNGEDMEGMFGGGVDDGYHLDQSGQQPLKGLVFPVALLSFDAFPEEDFVLLQWITESELNHEFFTIERSVDARHFEDVLQVDGAGTSSVRRLYEDRDLNPIPGTSYYRLRTNDFDGSVSLSQIVEVYFGQQTDWELNIFPNPTTADKISVELNGLETGKEIQLEMIDMAGKVIFQQALHSNSGHFTYSLNVPENIPPGSYLIRAGSEGKQRTKILMIR